jgi:hypothetical protein
MKSMEIEFQGCLGTGFGLALTPKEKACEALSRSGRRGHIYLLGIIHTAYTNIALPQQLILLAATLNHAQY